jgi:hypothetical protein
VVERASPLCDGGFSSLEVQRELRESKLSANARATGEVLTAEQSSNNDKGDVENTIQVLANKELKSLMFCLR